MRTNLLGRKFKNQGKLFTVVAVFVADIFFVVIGEDEYGSCHRFDIDKIELIKGSS